MKIKLYFLTGTVLFIIAIFMPTAIACRLWRLLGILLFLSYLLFFWEVRRLTRWREFKDQWDEDP